MITDRFMEDSDLPLLDLSLSQDKFHTGTTPEFFQAPGTVTKVYEDQHGPVLFVRGSSVLRLDIQYVLNEDIERNKAAMLEGFPPFAAKAKANGYSEIVFQTNNPFLARFCKQNFGFEKYEGEMRLLL